MYVYVDVLFVHIHMSTVTRTVPYGPRHHSLGPLGAMALADDSGVLTPPLLVGGAGML